MLSVLRKTAELHTHTRHNTLVTHSRVELTANTLRLPYDNHYENVHRAPILPSRSADVLLRVRACAAVPI